KNNVIGLGPHPGARPGVGARIGERLVAGSWAPPWQASRLTRPGCPASLTMSVDMSAASCLLTEDQFLCSICQDVFTHPVSTPCGHNFCKTCITKHWNINVLCQCPNCKEVFYTRPELEVNTFISEMAAQFRQSAQQKASSSSEQQVSKPGEVPCDVCTGTKLKALKSCLVCLAVLTVRLTWSLI
ncbi:hypothetical protein L3Q82_023592, partial [Scortum barcoo]